MNIVHVVAHNVSRLRRRQGWSQAKLGEECGLHRTYIGQIERAEKSIGIENLGRVATALGVPAARLVTRTGTQTSPAISNPYQADRKTDPKQRSRPFPILTP